MRKLIILAGAALGLLFASCTKEEQRTLSVIPAPLKVELQQEVFPLNPETGLYIDASEGDKKDFEGLFGGFFHEAETGSGRRGTYYCLEASGSIAGGKLFRGVCSDGNS